ncbi:MAG: phosphotransferase, partial [Longimicrobiales bacterium]
VRFIHHDLGPEHLILDPDTGRLVGILDWTDAILGDPARDFVFLVTWRGWSLVEQVLNSYPLAVDATFRDRLRRSARVLSVLWLAEAYE